MPALGRNAGGEGAIVVDLKRALEIGVWSAGSGSSEICLEFGSFNAARLAGFHSGDAFSDETRSLRPPICDLGVCGSALDMVVVVGGGVGILGR